MCDYCFAAFIVSDARAFTVVRGNSEFRMDQCLYFIYIRYYHKTT